MTRSLVTSLQWLVYFMELKHRMQLISNGKHAQDSVGITDLLKTLCRDCTVNCQMQLYVKYQIVVIFLMSVAKLIVDFVQEYFYKEIEFVSQILKSTFHLCLNDVKLVHHIHCMVM